MPNIAEAIAEGASLLRASNVAEERRTASLLLAHALDVDRTYILTRADEEVEREKYRAYLRMIERRARGEPLQHITGHQEFYGLDFIVTPDVLIPRPETEFLVERVIALADQEAPLIVDLGTGSGCIAMTLAFHIPGASLIATDISDRALAVARANAVRHAVSTRIDFIEGDLFEPLADRGIERKVDFLVSNPPYVPDEDIRSLQREVRDWEPLVALGGGPEGIDFYRRLLGDGRVYVRRGGYLVCEIGYSQLEQISDLIDPTAWELADVTEDLQGIPRAITIRRL
ncbi:MAG: peptide chain release factor N(5)-glutamine methyltransferase [Blastocatellia bacterium]|nr:peptide chain release factor N(5)-glutamine methyltransferase [Blastocatellia bacterium]